MERQAPWPPVVVLACILAGCAASQREREPDPADRLMEGLAALERQDYRAAFAPLSWVYSRYWNDPVGRQALLELAAAELDPRNPARRLGVGSDLAARYLTLPGTPAWTEPVAETLYLLGMELGAVEERVAEAEEAAREARAEAWEAEAEARRERAEAAPPQELPQLLGPPVAARVRRPEQDRAEAVSRVQQLERELAACDQELERVRQAARP